MPQRSRLRAFTLVEVLIVIAIVGLLVSLSIPAIQASRESARQTVCTSNQRQFAMAFSSFEGLNRTFPPSFTLKLEGPLSVDPSLKMHNFVVDLLPMFEATGVEALYDRSKMYGASENARAIQTPLSMTVCPSTPRIEAVPTTNLVPSLMFSANTRKRMAEMFAALDRKYSASFQGATTDYVVVTGVGGRLAQEQGYQVPKGVPGLHSMFPSPFHLGEAKLAGKILPIWFGEGESDLSVRTKSAQIVDGLTHTLMLVEVAGRPLRYRLGQRFAYEEPLESAWADPFTNIRVDGIVSGQQRLVAQTDNKDELFSFHPAGVNCTFADGHVAKLTSEIDPRVLIAMVTFDEGDVVSGEHPE